jgi:4-amino-4-deoxy-L-arabinose transferase-like glycosyltransferase
MSIATSPLLRTAPRWLVRPALSSPVCVAVLLGVSLLLFYYGLGTSELWRTESLRAIIAQQMLDSGDWIVPRLYGEPLFTKPPGMYIAIALCSLPLGHVTEVTARLPSALAATGCVLLFWWYFKRQLGRAAGLAAGLILPMSLMWLDKSSAAEIDMLQVFWVTASLICLFRATESSENPKSEIRNPKQIQNPKPEIQNTTILGGDLAFRILHLFRISRFGFRISNEAGSFGWWLAALVCVAGGFLTKWTAPEFFYGTAIPFLWWRGRLRSLWSWQHLASVAIAAAICLTWVAAAVHQEGWALLWTTVAREGGDRLIPEYDGRPYPWHRVLLHPAKVFATTLPWSALALVTLWPGFARLWDERERRLLTALHCWVWPHVLFWSLPTEHTARHSFPLFPGVAGLAAMVWFAWYDGRLAWRRWVPIRPVQLLGALLAVWFVLKLGFVHYAMPNRCGKRDATGKGALIASLVPWGKILYLFRLKDEGIMFYYGRPVLRLHAVDELPDGPAPVYCILTEEEWRCWPAERRAEAVQHLTDEQGDPLVLVRVLPREQPGIAHGFASGPRENHGADRESDYRPGQGSVGAGVFPARVGCRRGVIADIGAIGAPLLEPQGRGGALEGGDVADGGAAFDGAS